MSIKDEEVGLEELLRVLGSLDQYHFSVKAILSNWKESFSAERRKGSRCELSLCIRRVRWISTCSRETQTAAVVRLFASKLNRHLFGNRLVPLLPTACMLIMPHGFRLDVRSRDLMEGNTDSLTEKTMQLLTTLKTQAAYWYGNYIPVTAIRSSNDDAQEIESRVEHLRWINRDFNRTLTKPVWFDPETLLAIFRYADSLLHRQIWRYCQANPSVMRRKRWISKCDAGTHVWLKWITEPSETAYFDGLHLPRNFTSHELREVFFELGKTLQTASAGAAQLKRSSIKALLDHLRNVREAACAIGSDTCAEASELKQLMANIREHVWPLEALTRQIKLEYETYLDVIASENPPNDKKLSVEMEVGEALEKVFRSRLASLSEPLRQEVVKRQFRLDAGMDFLDSGVVSNVAESDAIFEAPGGMLVFEQGVVSRLTGSAANVRDSDEPPSSE